MIIGVLVYIFMRQNRERARNAPLRDEIAAGVCFETTLDRASFLGTGGFGGTRGVWIRSRGPKRLVVGTDAFMVSAPQALSEFVFRGSESSIAFGQAVSPDDCIMITGQAGGRQVQLAITGGNLPDIWQALAGTGAAFVLRVVNSESFRLFEVNQDGGFRPVTWRVLLAVAMRDRRLVPRVQAMRTRLRWLAGLRNP